MYRATHAWAAALLLAAVVMPHHASAQTATGNRANGRDYQPTRAEVIPREKAAGVEPPLAQQRANDRDLERINRQLLQSHGLDPNGAPRLAPGP